MFGVPIQEAVEVARVREDSDLPAVVFRCVQYLASVKAEMEEGIYRMSGSSAVIKALKDRFNAEGDVDLTTEYLDPHAVAGLLKTYFRELPVHIFTAELNPKFVRANDIESERDKVKEITRLVSLLPVANYSALRFLAAHLVNIVKQEATNKMSIRNMGIVFSPTLAIPASESYEAAKRVGFVALTLSVQLCSAYSLTNSIGSSAKSTRMTAKFLALKLRTCPTKCLGSGRTPLVPGDAVATPRCLRRAEPIVYSR